MHQSFPGAGHGPARTNRRSFLQAAAAGAGLSAGLGRQSAQAKFGKPGTPAGLDAYVEKAMANWKVPGLAVALVRDGKLVLARGYGVRALGAAGAVDAETVFSIASCTKAFTAAAIARLVD